MKITTKIPNEIVTLISNLKVNKTKRMSLLKVYNALLLKSKYKNKEGWFEVSSQYLLKVNRRYFSNVQFLIENNILEVLTRIYCAGDTHGPSNIFDKPKVKRTYSVNRGICMKYRFKIETECKCKKNITCNLCKTGTDIQIEFENPTIDKKWYKILNNSIQSLGYTPKIGRDRFGARVYHNLIMDYKEELKGKRLCTIDSQTSQPRLLYLMMKEKGIVDEKYFNIFENERDFYFELVDIFNLEDRDEAKKVFMYWALGNGYTKGYKIHEVFPVASHFLKNLKSTNYKDSSRYLCWKESRIFIDDLLNNLPVSFGIPVHDSIIVYQKDANKVIDYFKSKYPELRFKLTEI